MNSRLPRDCWTQISSTQRRRWIRTTVLQNCSPSFFRENTVMLLALPFHHGSSCNIWASMSWRPANGMLSFPWWFEISLRRALHSDHERGTAFSIEFIFVRLTGERIFRFCSLDTMFNIQLCTQAIQIRKAKFSTVSNLLSYEIQNQMNV